MARGLMVVLAFAAAAAQAQETTKAAEGTQRAALVGSEQPAMVLASRLAPQPSAGPLSLKAGSRDGGADAGSVAGEGTPDNLADCPAYETLLARGVVAARSYSPPPRLPTNRQEKSAPYVGTAVHCGRRYIFQILSQPKEPWAIKSARLEGPNGEVLQVHRLGFNEGSTQDVNVIVAEAPPGVQLTSLKLDLTGADGSVAQLEARDLP